MSLKRPAWRDWAWRFTLHVATGVAAVAAHYVTMSLLLQVHVPAVAASALGFLVGAWVRFHTAYHHVFSPTRSARSTVGRFVAALAAQFVANTAMLSALLYLGLPLWSAQVTTTVLLAFATFVVYRLLVFS